jgi:hypothetical protein
MGRLHGCRRLDGGGVRVRLVGPERAVVAELPARLRRVLAGDDAEAGPGERIHERLFPAAYADPMAELEYRSGVAAELSEERLAAVDAFAATLNGGRDVAGVWTVDLDADAAHAWLSALNDARLALAMVVGVTDEDHWEAGPDRSDRDAVLLWFLGWLQSELLEALMGHLEEH